MTGAWCCPFFSSSYVQRSCYGSRSFADGQDDDGGSGLRPWLCGLATKLNSL